MILPISKLPAKVLRTPTHDIEFPLKKAMLRLLQDMLGTVRKANGIGLAAPQIGKSFNFALIYLEEMGIPPFAIINPKILKKSKEMTLIEEGCLSIPGVYGFVKRPKKITVEFMDLEGKKHVITDDGWLARVIQHEIDHLHSTLIMDKLEKITQGEGLLKQFEAKV